MNECMGIWVQGCGWEGSMGVSRCIGIGVRVWAYQRIDICVYGVVLGVGLLMCGVTVHACASGWL